MFFVDIKNQKNKKGFTIIEILVVLLIITALSSLLIMGIDIMRKKTKDAIIISQLEQIQAIAETVYNPVTGYKELYDMREENHPAIKEIADKIKEMGGGGFNFNLSFPEDVSGEEGYYEYCAWVKLVQQPRNGPEKNFCVDSLGTSKIVDYKWGEIGYNCRIEDVPFNCNLY